MPRRGYRSITVNEDLYKRLIEFARSKCLSSINDAIVVLLEYANIYDKMEQLFKKVVPYNMVQSGESSIKSSMYRTSTVHRKKTAIEILKEQGVIFESNIARRLRDPNSFFNKLKREGAIIIESDVQRIAVDPSFWKDFLDKLENINFYDEELVKKTLDPKQYELFNELRLTGMIYFDRVKNKWVLLEEIA